MKDGSESLGRYWFEQGVSGASEYIELVCYEKALDADPHHATAWHNMGCVLQEEKTIAEVKGGVYRAKKCFQMAARLKSNPPGESEMCCPLLCELATCKENLPIIELVRRCACTSKGEAWACLAAVGSCGNISSMH